MPCVILPCCPRFFSLFFQLSPGHSPHSSLHPSSAHPMNRTVAAIRCHLIHSYWHLHHSKQSSAPSLHVSSAALPLLERQRRLDRPPQGPERCFAVVVVDSVTLDNLDDMLVGGPVTAAEGAKSPFPSPSPSVSHVNVSIFISPPHRKSRRLSPSCSSCYSLELAFAA